jgi:predicted nucleic acid-binding protein
MALVVDASIALAWGLSDESSAYAEAVLAVVERDGLRVPDLWAREIANGLAVAYRRRRITTADQHAFLTALAHLHIDVEQPSSPTNVIRVTTAAAMRYGLTAYDASYVVSPHAKASCLPRSTRQCARSRNDSASRSSNPPN